MVQGCWPRYCNFTRVINYVLKRALSISSSWFRGYPTSHYSSWETEGFHCLRARPEVPAARKGSRRKAQLHSPFIRVGKSSGPKVHSMQWTPPRRHSESLLGTPSPARRALGEGVLD